jgi:hypothetical protein
MRRFFRGLVTLLLLGRALMPSRKRTLEWQINRHDLSGFGLILYVPMLEYTNNDVSEQSNDKKHQ